MKVYGVAEYRKLADRLNLDFLQTMPKLMYGKNRFACYVGSELVKYIISEANNGCVELFAFQSAVEFYKKMGFYPLDKISKDLIHMRLNIRA